MTTWPAWVWSSGSRPPNLYMISTMTELQKDCHIFLASCREELSTPAGEASPRFKGMTYFHQVWTVHCAGCLYWSTSEVPVRLCRHQDKHTRRPSLKANDDHELLLSQVFEQGTEQQWQTYGHKHLWNSLWRLTLVLAHPYLKSGSQQ